MRALTHLRARAAGAAAAAVVVVAVAACGGSATTAKTPVKATPAATAAATTPPAPTTHVRILSPTPGAHTGPTVRVRSVVVGAPARAISLRYVLDGGRTRRGSRHFELQNLAPGHHHLVVLLAGHQSVKATRSFVVRTPPSPPTTPVAPPQAAPVPAPAAAPAPAPSGGIPQNNGGDGDSDNSGGPSDGDGNI